ncbi:MAG: alanine--tRNA ligase [Gammaproteobacteria bacterium]|nr:alanine--tRNA ligase [Gammaproteobacteria bacterium]
MTGNETRRKFLEYFEKHKHRTVRSSSLVPHDDPTLLFTNAGMVQFKRIFLGEEKRDYNRATTSQKCVRAGGKHNDLENVGYTARHHTFFEMLGNFSFGDYFKEKAVEFAWDLLTNGYGLPPEKLWASIYLDDDEAYELWNKNIGIPEDRIVRLGEEDNFWAMGDTGPCGPCSEIFYDHGPNVWGGPPGSPEEEGDRYIEIWNLVFMQYDRDASGNLNPLPKPSVDTGMGLERLAAVMQQVHSNYEIDLFQNLIQTAARITGCKDFEDKSLRVIADHIRSCAFLVVDGVIPSNEGRGYVLRRIIRRAIRHGYMLGIKQPFFYRLVATLSDEMGDAYPELRAAQDQVERTLRHEEERFAETLEQGMKILDHAIESLKGNQISGETLFRLYDTYGFPTDLTADIARERNLTVDMDGFEVEMEAQRERARAASHFGATEQLSIEVESGTEFTGYEKLQDKSRVIALFREGRSLDRVEQEGEAMVVLDRTPFYAESGGQVGDKGVIGLDEGSFEVLDTQKQAGDVVVHVGRFRGTALQVGETVSPAVDLEKRTRTALHHSATHLLHAALRQILGDHVQQKGSLVDPDRLRFDFSHFEPISRNQLLVIERLVNQQIRANHAVETRIMSLDDAKAAGAMALFGEKYTDKVRVLSMGGFSTELCGGTHVNAVGNIGLFRITAESGIASGVRRIEAVAGEPAIDLMESDADRLHRVAQLVKAGREDVDDKVAQLTDKARRLEKELDQLKAKLASAAGSDLAGSAIDVSGVKVLAAALDGANAKELRNTMDQLKNKLGSAAIVLAGVTGDKVSLVAGVSKDQTSVLEAGDLVKFVAEQVGGRGGGRPDMAQAGGNDPSALPAALESVEGWVRNKLTA